MDKILIIRFSSIGDIVLTSPVIRALHQLPKRPEIHFITKKKFASTLRSNPYIDKLYTFEKEITEISEQLKTEHYTYVIDLHSNLRSKRLKLLLGVQSESFEKLNIKKWLKVKLKYDRLPNTHIVDRYLETIAFLGGKNDEKGLDYFISEDEQKVATQFNELYPNGYYCFVVGGAHYTKQIPVTTLVVLANASKLPVVLLGGPEDAEKANIIIKQVDEQTVHNACGTYSLNESAAILKGSNKVVSADTGLMHIASAFQKEILSLWGNTIPEFGMSPYFSSENKNKNHQFEVKGLSCRPCSKIGYAQCPKKHFKCMLDLDINAIIKQLNT